MVLTLVILIYRALLGWSCTELGQSRGVCFALATEEMYLEPIAPYVILIEDLTCLCLPVLLYANCCMSLHVLDALLSSGRPSQVQGDTMV